MDWKKYFGTADQDEKKHNFKKFDTDEEDDDFSDLETFFNEFHGNSKFGFRGVPPSLLKQFNDVLEAIEDLNRKADGSVIDDEQKQKVFDKYFEFKKEKRDYDLDDRYADQLDSLLKRISPDLMIKDDPIIPSVVIIQKPARKLTDEEKIMDKIHGTFKEEVIIPRPHKKEQIQKAPLTPHHHFGALPPFNEFPPSHGANSQNKTWGKTVITIRKSDGTYENQKIERSSDGQVKTTITKTDADGNKSTQTFLGDKEQQKATGENKVISTQSIPHEERNLINHNGYKIPCLF